MLSLAKSVTSFFLANLLSAIAESSSSKKGHIFLANLKRILKHSLSVREIFLVQKFNGEMLKISNQSEFLLKIN